MRAAFARARNFGLAARHAAKLERVHAACAVTPDGTVHCTDSPPYDMTCPRRRTPLTWSTPAAARATRPTVAARPSAEPLKPTAAAAQPPTAAARSAVATRPTAAVP